MGAFISAILAFAMGGRDLGTRQAENRLGGGGFGFRGRGETGFLGGAVFLGRCDGKPGGCYGHGFIGVILIGGENSMGSPGSPGAIASLLFFHPLCPKNRSQQ